MLPPSTPLVVYVSDDRWSPSQFRWQCFPPTESIGLNGEGQRAREHAIDLVAEDTNIAAGTAIPPKRRKKLPNFQLPFSLALGPIAARLYGTRPYQRSPSIPTMSVSNDKSNRWSSEIFQSSIKVPCVRVGQYTLTAG